MSVIRARSLLFIYVFSHYVDDKTYSQLVDLGSLLSLGISPLWLLFTYLSQCSFLSKSSVWIGYMSYIVVLFSLIPNFEGGCFNKLCALSSPFLNNQCVTPNFQRAGIFTKEAAHPLLLEILV